MQPRTNVITYQSSNGRSVTLSIDQIAMLESVDKWLRDSRGSWYATVIYGEHVARPTYTDDQIRRIAGIPAPTAAQTADYI